MTRLRYAAAHLLALALVCVMIVVLVFALTPGVALLVRHSHLFD